MIRAALFLTACGLVAFACQRQPKRAAVDAPRSSSPAIAEAFPATGPGAPRKDLSPAQLAEFQKGLEVFKHDFTPAEGLGPEYNNSRCNGCHYLPTVGGGGSAQLGMRLVSLKGSADLGAWMRHAIPGFPDPPPKPPMDFMIPLSPPPLLGVAQFDALSDAEIVANCDPEDRDHDGVRGHAAVRGDGRIGRFGHQLTEPSLLDMVSHAAMEEIGLTSAGPGATRRPHDDDSVPDPELPMDKVRALVAYVEGLAPPPRDGNDPEGEGVFLRIGCAACHKPVVANKLRGAYTDLCLHDMGKAFDTGIQEVNYSARSTEWRTTPLWGLRFRQAFMHDDRVTSLDEAIRIHGGEAKGARDRYVRLTEGERAAVLRFLKTL